MSKEPTARQAEILAYMRESMRERGVPPTIREIAVRFAIRSPNGVQSHLRALFRKGLVRHLEHAASRGWIPVDEPKGIPLLTFAAIRAQHPITD